MNDFSESDELHWHPVWDDEDMYNSAYVKRKESDTCYGPVNKSKVQPSSETFIVIKPNDRKKEENDSHVNL